MSLQWLPGFGSNRSPEVVSLSWLKIKLFSIRPLVSHLVLLSYDPPFFHHRMCRLPYSIRGSVENNHFYFKYPILEQLLSTVVLARNNYDVETKPNPMNPNPKSDFIQTKPIRGPRFPGSTTKSGQTMMMRRWNPMMGSEKNIFMISVSIMLN